MSFWVHSNSYILIRQKGRQSNKNNYCFPSFFPIFRFKSFNSFLKLSLNEFRNVRYLLNLNIFPKFLSPEKRYIAETVIWAARFITYVCDKYSTIFSLVNRFSRNRNIFDQNCMFLYFLIRCCFCFSWLRSSSKRCNCSSLLKLIPERRFIWDRALSKRRWSSITWEKKWNWLHHIIFGLDGTFFLTFWLQSCDSRCLPALSVGSFSKLSIWK